MANKPYRLMYRFWLDITKQNEEDIADKIEILKSERSFTQTIRDGIRLIFDLKQGKLDVLFELFPWVRAEFMDYMRDIQPVVVTQVTETTTMSQVTDAQQAWLDAEEARIEAERQWHEKRLADSQKALEEERKQIEAERTQNQKIMQAQLDRLEQLLLQQGNQPISNTLQPLVSGGGGSGPKQLAVPQFTAPVFDDDEDFELNIHKDEHSGAQAALNFINSIQQLHQ